MYRRNSATGNQIVINYKVGFPYVVTTTFRHEFYDTNTCVCNLEVNLIKLDRQLKGVPSDNVITKKAEHFSDANDIDEFLRREGLLDTKYIERGRSVSCMLKFNRRDVVRNLTGNDSNNADYLKMKLALLDTSVSFIDYYAGLQKNINNWVNGKIPTNLFIRLLDTKSFKYCTTIPSRIKTETVIEMGTAFLRCTYSIDEQVKGPKHIFSFTERTGKALDLDLYKYQYRLQKEDIPALMTWFLQSAEGFLDDSLIENKTVYINTDCILSNIRNYILLKDAVDMSNIRDMLSIRLNNYNYDTPYKAGKAAGMYKLRKGRKAIRRWKNTGYLVNIDATTEALFHNAVKDIGKFSLLNKPYNTFRVFVDKDLNIVDIKVCFLQERMRYRRW